MFQVIFSFLPGIYNIESKYFLNLWKYFPVIDLNITKIKIIKIFYYNHNVSASNSGTDFASILYLQYIFIVIRDEMLTVKILPG